jgi:hypothetical protein
MFFLKKKSENFGIIKVLNTVQVILNCFDGIYYTDYGGRFQSIDFVPATYLEICEHRPELLELIDWDRFFDDVKLANNFKELFYIGEYINRFTETPCIKFLAISNKNRFQEGYFTLYDITVPLENNGYKTSTESYIKSERSLRKLKQKITIT